jgi:hypothetical protein
MGLIVDILDNRSARMESNNKLMSADNGIILNLSKLEVSEYMGDSVCNKKKFKTLEEAIKYCQEIGETEYGIQLTGKLKLAIICN